MATIFPYETECAVCGKTSPQVSAAAVESDAYPDLDTRPGGEEVRAAYTYRIQRCPHCGYCAPEIELDYPLAADAVRRADYKAILHRQSLSDLGRAFLAWARIQELNEEHNGAAWATLHAILFTFIVGGLAALAAQPARRAGRNGRQQTADRQIVEARIKRVVEVGLSGQATEVQHESPHQT